MSLASLGLRAASSGLSWVSALPTPEAPPSRRLRLVAWVAAAILLLCGVQALLLAQTAGGTTYSQQDVANLLANSSNSYLASNASTFAAVSRNVEDPNGNTATYNGSCCTGLFQLNQTNLQTFCGCTPTQFGTMSGQQQVAVYSAYFSSIQNDPSIKQLQQLQASGGTLGGQPVTGATIAACAQLGTGNCRAAIANGCSSVANGQGGDGHLNVCTFAAKASGGQQVAPNGAPVTNPTPGQPATPAQPAPSPSSNDQVVTGDLGVQQQIGAAAQDFVPEDPGAAGSLNAIGDPTFCWVCDGALYSLGVVEAVVTGASPRFVTLLWPLMTALAATSLLFCVGAALISGQDPVRAALRRLVRIVIVLSLFAGGALQPLSSGEGGSNPILDYVVSPPLSLGAAIGSDLVVVSAAAFTQSLPPGNCQHDDLGTAGVHALADAGNALVQLACYVHQTAAVAIQVGGIMITHPHTDQSKVEIGAAFILAAVGCLVMATAILALINFGFAFIEAILKVGVVVAFLPLLVFATIFDATRGMVKVVFDSMIFAFFYLVFTGVCASVMVFVFLNAFTFGLAATTTGAGTTQPTGPVPLSAAVSMFDQLAANQGLVTASGFAALVQFCCFTAAGALMSGRMLSAAHDLAVEVSEFGLGQRGALAEVGQRLVGRGVAIASVGVGLGAALGGRAVGAGVGALVGRGQPGAARAPRRR